MGWGLPWEVGDGLPAQPRRAVLFTCTHSEGSSFNTMALNTIYI